MDRIFVWHKMEHWLYTHKLNFLAQILRGGVKLFLLPIFLLKWK